MVVIYDNIPRSEVDLVRNALKVPLVSLEDALESRLQAKGGSGARPGQTGAGVPPLGDLLRLVVQLVVVVGFVVWREAEPRSFLRSLHGGRMAGAGSASAMATEVEGLKLHKLAVEEEGWSL